MSHECAGYHRVGPRGTSVWALNIGNGKKYDGGIVSLVSRWDIYEYDYKNNNQQLGTAFTTFVIFFM